MEATIHVPEDFEEAENCFLGMYTAVSPLNFGDELFFNDCSLSLDPVNFSNGQLLPSALNQAKVTLYEKTNDRTKKRRVMVRS